MVARQVDQFKVRGITAMVTSLGNGDEASAVGVTSLVATWLLLRNVESDGERNRLLFVMKSRGTAHSNQVREFVLTENGVDLLDVYVGRGRVLAGSAQLAQQTAEREGAAERDAGVVRR
jgi:circadian clock protein KaiC